MNPLFVVFRRVSLICFFCGLLSARAVAELPYVIIDGHKYDPFSVLARLKDTDKPSREKMAKLLTGMKLTVQDESKLVPGLVTIETKAADRKKKRPSYNLGVAQAKALKRMVRQLQASELFRYVELNPIIELNATPSDVGFTEGHLWGLRNTGQFGGASGVDVGAVEAWDVTTGSDSVVVAVVDSGIRETHVDLAPNMWINQDEVLGNGVDDDRDGIIDNKHGMNALDGSANTSDDNGHGSHCAGTIGAVANNSGAITGVAWKVKLMSCKVFDAQGKTTGSAVKKAVEFATINGARIISMSLGGRYAGIQADRDFYEAVGRQGALLVVSAGNDSVNNDVEHFHPVNYATPTMIGVAAIDRAGALASFSNWGKTKIHLGAPGVDIWSCGHGSDTAVEKKAGTSMAAPHVAGVAALVLAKFPNLTAIELKERLISSVTPTPSLAGITITGGRVNAKNALGATSDARIEVRVNPPTGATLQGGQTVTLAVEVTDVAPITNATVTGRTGQGTQVNFLNNGAAPDAQANDHVYTASLTLPSNAGTFTLELSVNAPGKNPLSQSLSYPMAAKRTNDRFQDRFVITGVNETVTANNRDATLDPGEQQYQGLSSKTVWWTWTPSNSGRVTLTTAGSDFDTVMGVYEGTSHANLNLLYVNDEDNEGDEPSVITFDAVAGKAYQIMIDGMFGAAGNVRLTLRQVGSGNDAFGQSIRLTGNEIKTIATNESATKEQGEPNHGGEPGGKSLWWTWTAPGPGRVEIDTHSSDFDTLLAVYKGTNLRDLQVVAQNDDTPFADYVSSVLFNTVGGVTYHIAVDGYEAEFGEIQLQLRFTPGQAPPANDDFTKAQPLAGSQVSATGTNRGATKQDGEPDHDDNPGGQSVWWFWAAPATGSVSISTEGSDFDTLLAVYTAGQNQLVAVASNDDAESEENFTTGYSVLSFQAQAGQAYAIAVDGFRDDEIQQIEEGSIKLALSQGGQGGPPPQNRPPVVQITAPVSGARFTAPAKFEIKGTASDPDGQITKIQLLVGGQVIGEHPGATEFSFNAEYPAGTFVTIARAFDDKGAFTDSPSVTTFVGTDPPPPSPTDPHLPTPTPPSVPSSDLLGYWAANEGSGTVINSLPQSLLNATLSRGSWGPGRSGQAGDFAFLVDGRSDGTSHGFIPATGLTFKEITITGWVKGRPTGAWTGLIQARQPGRPIGIGFRDNTGELTYTWNNDSPNTYSFPSGLRIPRDEWAFVALSLKADRATLFVGDRTGLRSRTNVLAHIEQVNDLTGWHFGIDNCCGGGRNFNGAMDDISIWKVALSTSDIQALFDGGKTPLSLDSSQTNSVGGGPNLISQTQFTNGAFGLALQSKVGERYDIEYSPDLRNWSVVSSDLSGTGQVLSYFDSNAQRNARRTGYYRARRK